MMLKKIKNRLPGGVGIRPVQKYQKNSSRVEKEQEKSA